MKAVICKAYGPPESLVIEDIDEPHAGPGQIVVDIKAAAVNFPDLLIIENKYQFKPELPFTPGGEIAGVISEVGEGVTNLHVGDRILASAGSAGGFQEKIAIPAGAAYIIPDSMDFPRASSMLLTYATTHYALCQRGNLRAEETMLVLGAAGGIGTSAIEIGKALGATVIAAASTDEKLELCRELGADLTINYSTEDLKTRTKELTGGQGVDVIFDPVGGEYAEPALRAMAWDGRYLVIGFTAGIPKIPLNLTLLKSCNIIGVFWGAFTTREPQKNRENIEELMRWYEEGKVRPHISKTYGFHQVAEALREVGDRKVKGKVVIVPPE